MISNQFGDRGVDRNNNGILDDSEIDIRSTAQIGGYGIPHTKQQESPAGSGSMPGIQKPMYGGCFDVSESALQWADDRKIDIINIVPGVNNVPTNIPTPKYIKSVTDKFTCEYGSKTDNTWSYDVANHGQVCKTSTGGIIKKNKLNDDSLLKKVEANSAMKALGITHVLEKVRSNPFPISNPTNATEYKINCEYNNKSGNVWVEDYLRPGEFEDKSLSTVLEEINNGRVSDIDIFKDIDTKQADVVMNHDNQETAIKGIVEETALSSYFFSKQNMKALQDSLCYRVYQQTNEYIDYQSENELYIVMRSILIQHGNFKVNPDYLLTELHKLNALVLKYCVKEVSSNVLQYKGYLNDLQKLPVPIDRPSYNESGSRNRTYDLSNHIAPTSSSGWASRHNVD